jgi:hypothetical protein
VSEPARIAVIPILSDTKADRRSHGHPALPANGGTGYEVINYKDGLCLDVSGWAGLPGKVSADTANNLPLTVYPCYNSAWGNNGYDDHLWELVPYL